MYAASLYAAARRDVIDKAVAERRAHKDTPETFFLPEIKTAQSRDELRKRIRGLRMVRRGGKTGKERRVERGVEQKMKTAAESVTVRSTEAGKESVPEAQATELKLNRWAKRRPKRV
ncbi:hypothetical protein OPT61_g10227 [Boeremia exigua]|uniref:Uncharacterized protein n=1 Tax=Boeremia exigua TaxID=749465 RepID=A0ACC2HRH1_9PLEO|nr:hypothetical protein OPT61_g10227 [Boeremia exigua]